MTRSPTHSDAPTAAQPPLLQDIRSLIDAARSRRGQVFTFALQPCVAHKQGVFCGH